MTDIENLYLEIGGRFLTPFSEIKHKLQNIRAFLFDWDGVFNTGEKNVSSGSGFSEVDSMGTNLLRYAHFLKNGTTPLTGILSGEKNDTAFYFSEREAFNYCYHKVPQKMEAFRHFCESEKLEPDQVAYFFDDVLDLPIAEVCGIRILVNQKINPLFINHCERNGLADYLTASSGGSFAVRESTELLIAMTGKYEEVIEGRRNNVTSYQQYLQQKRQAVPGLFSLINNSIVPSDPRHDSRKK